jgi:hypothetical protein
VVNSLFDYKVEVKISDLSGKTLYFSDAHMSNRPITLGEDLPEGMYMVEVRTEYETKTFRILKVNR